MNQIAGVMETYLGLLLHSAFLSRARLAPFTRTINVPPTELSPGAGTLLLVV
jgi:hypothetical protein